MSAAAMGPGGLPPVDGELLDRAVRMIVPLRREFGHRLDVVRFFNDIAYARSVLTEALQSRDERLREQAHQLNEGLPPAYRVGPRLSTLAPEADASAPPAPEPAEPSPEDARARMLRKYTKGLR